MAFILVPEKMKDRRLLLGSGGFGGVPEGRPYLAKQMREFLGSANNIVFIGYATHDPKESLKLIEQYNMLPDHKVTSITDFSDPAKAVMEADGIIVFGGNTFRLLSRLYENKLIKPLRERVMAGIPYIGASAGSNVIGPTIRTTNDMPIVSTPTLEALGLVNFQINPHYVSGAFYSQVENNYVKYAGETRDDRINEFHEENNTDVVGIPEATFLKVTGTKTVYLSSTKACARLFRKGKAPQDFEPGTDLSEILAK